MSTTPTRRRAIGSALAAAVTIALLGAAPAPAAGTTSAVCTNLFSVTINPGFSMTPTSGTLTTGGETGSITCVGEIDGHRITGPGTMGISENYTNVTCPSSVIKGTINVSIPTTAGLQRMAGELTVQRTLLAVQPQAEFPNAHFSGIGVIIPTQGNCFVTPLRKSLLSVTGTLTGT
ncbi:MAG: hypothetical protein QOG15_2401 [Solirubrobacteraceae bacterium]|jgi:hypothetical protein|nr:hypothetical protein [Solirubrobacteraceae bacterium]